MSSWTKSKNVFWAFVVLVLLGIGVFSEARATGQATRVGMIRLLALPERYDHKHIRTWGFLHLGSRFDDRSLWFHEDDLKAALFVNSVALSLSFEEMRPYLNLNHTYVVVEGTFHSNRPNSTALDSGAIMHITNIASWSPSTVATSPSK